MADEDTPHANGNGHEENGHVPEIELIIKVRKVLSMLFQSKYQILLLSNIYLSST